MNVVFQIVAGSLDWIAHVTGFTYNEINIIAYYIVLPFIYVALVDRILRKHFLKIAYVIIWAVIICLLSDFSAFSDVWFKRSVDFLLLFDRVGLNYVAASVVVCVILPAIAFAALFLWAFPSVRSRLLNKNARPASA